MNHLVTFLEHMIPIWQKQLLQFSIIVVEQYGSGLFNKGRLMNSAYVFAATSSRIDFDCVIFHDVDLLPNSDRLSYQCQLTPAHLAAYVDTLGHMFV